MEQFYNFIYLFIFLISCGETGKLEEARIG